MNCRSVLATTILIGEKSSTSCLIARHLDEKSRDCKQRIAGFVAVMYSVHLSSTYLVGTFLHLQFLLRFLVRVIFFF